MQRSERLERGLTPPSKICQPNCAGPESEYSTHSNKISLYFLGENNTSFTLVQRVSWYSNTNSSLTSRYFLVQIRFELLQKCTFLQHDPIFPPYHTSLFLTYITCCIQNPVPTLLCTAVCVCAHFSIPHVSGEKCPDPQQLAEPYSELTDI